MTGVVHEPHSILSMIPAGGTVIYTEPDGTETTVPVVALAVVAGYSHMECGDTTSRRVLEQQAEPVIATPDGLDVASTYLYALAKGAWWVYVPGDSR